MPLFIMAQEITDTSIRGKNIDKYLQYFSNENPGAVVMVIKNGEIVFNKAYGLSNIESKEPMNVDKAFNLDELSKAFTSLAIMKLVEKKKLKLDQSLVDIFSDFPEYGRNIKVRNLLSHASGLKPYDANLVKTNTQVFEFLKEQTEPLFEAGTKMNYSNSDYAMLAYIIEKVSKSTYSEFLTKNIFKKAKMKNTWIAGDNSKTLVAEGHFKEEGNYKVRNEKNTIYGEKGIFSTSTDFALWDKAMHSNKLVKPESLAQIFTVEKIKDSENNSYYGYGWVIMKRNDTWYYWHSGTGNGYTNLLLYLPDTKTTVLILTNRNDGYDFLKLSIAIAKEFDKELKL